MLHTHFINGEWVAGEGHELSSIDPAKNVSIWQGKSATSAQIDAAINAARNALPQWSMMSVEARLTIIKAYGEKLAENKEYLAKVMAQETGHKRSDT